ncbi:MAG: S-methyl-5-thioribose-1-phosphate isomerase, partial [Candidatus Limnocylindrales bacterium]
IQTAATVVGAATALQRTSAEAANALLDPTGTVERLGNDPTAGQSTPALVPQPTAVFRTSFRVDGDRLILVDQRKLPEEVVDYECLTAADVAFAIRERIVRGAPALAQVAALGLALTAHRVRDTKPFARRATLNGSANAVINASPTSITVRAAVGRMLARYDALGELSDDGDAVADALRREADAIVFEATEAHGRIAEHGLAELPEPAGRPLRILTIGSSGVLAGGQFGTALGVIVAAAAAGRPMQVDVCETRPLLEGARLTAWELGNAGVPYRLIADAAAAGRMARGEVDIVLVAGDRLAANGDVAAIVGTYALALAAARHAVPFIVCAALSSMDLDTPDGSGLAIDERSAAEVLWARGARIAPVRASALNPATDVTPAELLTAIVTEAGVLRPPWEPALRAAVEEARAARTAADVALAAGAAPEATSAAPAPGSEAGA